MLKTRFNSLVVLILPMMLASCGQSHDAISSTASCGGRSVASTEQDQPSDISGLYEGDFQSHQLSVDLTSDGRHAQLVVDGVQAVALSLVARLYCSDSVGMFGNAATRVDSTILVTLARTPQNVRSLNVNRWNL